MNARTLLTMALAAAVAAGPAVTTALAAGEMFVPLLVYRTGPYAPNGIPLANGFNDYFNLLNDRDGGVNGVRIAFEECETQYDTKQGVECYERLKGKSPVLVNPFSTGITYQLIPKAPGDKIVVHSSGYGMTASADGRWFPWVFNFPMTYWSQASAFVKYVAQQEGGTDKLKGKKIVHVYHNSPYGKEANPTLETLARDLGFELTLLAVDHPGQEQKSTWLQVRRLNPAWIYVSGWGVMNQVAVKGEQLRWGMENLNVTEKRLEELGMKGMLRPLRMTCENHEGNGMAAVQQWDGKKWTIISDWIEPMRDVVRPKLEAAAIEEAKKLGYVMRDCAKEK